MDLDLSEEQRLLRDTLDRFLGDTYSFERRKAHAAEPDGWSRAVWAQLAELGILGAALPEEQGGFGGGAVATMLVMEALGPALTLEPYLSTVVLGAAALRHGGSPAQQAEHLPAIVAGERLFALAHGERQARYDLFDVATTARPDGDGFLLDGTKSLVLHGDTADVLIVSARLTGGRRDPDGISLFLVPADAPGIERRGYPTQDGRRAAEITFNDVRVGADAVLGEAGGALSLIERIVEAGTAALCAEAVGLMTATVDETVGYLKTRKQFGAAIGSFQALQHRAADMVVALEQARSMALFATMALDEEDAGARSRAISAAKVQINRSSRFIGQQAVQLHGGVGMTMEYRVGHLFKRLTMIEIAFGDADHHLARLAEAGSLIEA